MMSWDILNDGACPHLPVGGRERDSPYRISLLEVKYYINYMYLPENLSDDDLRMLQIILLNGDRKHRLELEGGGFTSDVINRVYSWLTPCNCYSKDSKKTIEKYGDWKIHSIVIGRKPIIPALTLALNLASFGYWAKTMKQFGFDTFFHLFMIVRVKKGDNFKDIIVEKNERINVNSSFKLSGEAEYIGIKGVRKYTLNNLLENAREVMGNEKYFQYDAFKNNCQVFIKTLLKSSGLLTKKADRFIFQDVSELVGNLPKFIPALAKTATNIAGILKV